jgi:hypothetical protein
VGGWEQLYLHWCDPAAASCRIRTICFSVNFNFFKVLLVSYRTGRIISSVFISGGQTNRATERGGPLANTRRRGRAREYHVAIFKQIPHPSSRSGPDKLFPAFYLRRFVKHENHRPLQGIRRMKREPITLVSAMQCERWRRRRGIKTSSHQHSYTHITILGCHLYRS